MLRELPKRKTNRLSNYDYSLDGAYFITICTKDRQELLWESVGANCVRQPNVHLSRTGKVVEYETKRLETIYDCVDVDCFVIMPNHVHMIIVIESNGRTQFAPTVSRVVKQWKGVITKQIGFSPWQKSYHDHIIRNDNEYNRIAEYIEYNPARWSDDCFHPKNLSKPFST